MDRVTHSREMVFCHVCENEWFRDEHGLVCPDCQSDFTEIVCFLYRFLVGTGSIC